MPMRCPTCGSQYGDDARFCTKDGTKLAAAGEPSARATAVRGEEGPSGSPNPAATSHANMDGQVLDRR